MLTKFQNDLKLAESLVIKTYYDKVEQGYNASFIGKEGITLDTILISWIITGKLELAFSIGSIELITKMILYFFHERAWNTIKWGK